MDVFSNGLTNTCAGSQVIEETDTMKEGEWESLAYLDQGMCQTFSHGFVPPFGCDHLGSPNGTHRLGTERECLHHREASQ